MGIQRVDQSRHSASIRQLIQDAEEGSRESRRESPGENRVQLFHEVHKSARKIKLFGASFGYIYTLQPISPDSERRD